MRQKFFAARLEMGCWIFILPFMFSACTAEHAKDTREPSPIRIEGEKIVVEANSPFLHNIEIEKISSEKKLSQDYQSVGQMLLLANSSENLTSNGLSWVELDPGLTKAAGVNLKNLEGGVGTAYGNTSIPIDYATSVKPGQTIEISRYGLKKVNTKAKIFLVKTNPALGALQVIFQISSGRDWYPGTNCEVHFPLLKSHPIEIPKTALLHEGLVDFLFVEIAPNQFQPRRVTVLSETREKALIVARIEPSERLVSRGAILLKPLLTSLLTKLEKDETHVP